MRCFYKNLAAKFLFFGFAFLQLAYSAGGAAPADPAPVVGTVRFPPGIGTVVCTVDAKVPLSLTPNRRFTQIQPVQGVPAVNLYFPVNGVQPNTQQAGLWSGAQVRERAVNRAIAEWYMKMFGWIQKGTRGARATQLQMGYTPLAADVVNPAAQNPAPIITFDATMNADMRRDFWDAFRTIAGDPVGRVLLYRLLIEIRRENGHRVGCEERGASPAERTRARQLLIEYVNNHGDWGYNNVAQARLSVCFDVPGVNVTLVTSLNQQNPVAQNTLYTAAVPLLDMPCALFHEMLHWYQQLKDPDRYIAECQNDIATIAGNDLSAYLGYPIAPAASGDFLSWATVAMARNPVIVVIKLDEMRVICGSNAAALAAAGAAADYKEGDDLSENAFRCSRRLKMRFGHGGAIDLPLVGAIPQAYARADQAIRRAHGWASQCVQNILGLAAVPPWWGLTPGGAL